MHKTGLTHSQKVRARQGERKRGGRSYQGMVGGSESRPPQKLERKNGLWKRGRVTVVHQPRDADHLHVCAPGGSGWGGGVTRNRTKEEGPKASKGTKRLPRRFKKGSSHEKSECEEMRRSRRGIVLETEKCTGGGGKIAMLKSAVHVVFPDNV